MKLLLKNHEAKLLANATASAESEGGIDHYPVVKFFNPCGAYTCLVTEMDEDGTMFGLADMGFGSPEMGSISYDELKSIRLPFGLGIERDMHFEADKTLSEYATEAKALGRIAA